MSVSEDLINFDIIETQKENIQSLPQGRSAKALASAFSASPFSPIHTPGATRNLNDTFRAEYEAELQTIDDSDDPLDIYDRYVKWTFNAYPTAQATPESQLRPLLERATKAFQNTPTYKNDPRYLKLWIHYIRLFSDAPREVFAYLSRHGIGEGLALYYEEFAAWLEGVGRWNQAEEIYKLGIEREARPSERLLRKFGEFQKRYESRSANADEPSSPALPTVRPALAAKLDPYASTSRTDDPQAQRLPSAATSSRSGRQKMAIFADADGSLAGKPENSDASKGWDSIGSIKDRKKENIVEAKPWAGETLKAGKKLGNAPKMTIFRDQSMSEMNTAAQHVESPLLSLQETMNPKTGKLERICANLPCIYPSATDELCFAEVMARHRGWMAKDWSQERQITPLRIDDAKGGVQSTTDRLAVDTEDVEEQDVTSNITKDISREDNSGKPRRKKTIEVKGETQTVKLNLSSPSKTKKVRRKSTVEPTMTLHSRAATDEVLDMFNQTLRNVGSITEEPDHFNDSDYEDDDYTSGGESTCNDTERLSGAGSEYGEETEAVDGTSQIPDVAANLEDNLTTTESNLTTAETNAWSEPLIAKSVPELSALDTSAARSDEDVKTPDSHDPPNGFGPQFMPSPPEGVQAPTHPYRDANQMNQNRLPFMTPIVEMTESSVSMTSSRRPGDYMSSKTPSRRRHDGEATIPELEDLILEDMTEAHGLLVVEKEDKEITFSNATESVATKDESLDPEAGVAEEIIPTPELEKADLNAADSLELAESVSLDQNTQRDISLDQLVLSDTILVGTPAKHETRATTEAIGKPNRDVVIFDDHVNPVDEEIRQKIIKTLTPSLSSYPGFYDHKPAVSQIKPDLDKLSRAGAKKIVKNTTEKTDGEIVFEPLPTEVIAVKQLIGKGGWASVFLVENQSTDGQSYLQAMKSEFDPSAWEFAIMALTHARIEHWPQLESIRTSASIAKPLSFHSYNDAAYMFESFHEQGNLLELVNKIKADALPAGSASGASTPGIDEHLAMFFAIEILRSVSDMHSVGILHCDIKADNFLVRLSPIDEPEWNAIYSATGENGWSEKGIVLIDFGRAIDTLAFKPDTCFYAEWATDKHDCPEQREARPWTYQADLWGIASIFSVLLFGKVLEEMVVVEPSSTSSSTTMPINGSSTGNKRYRPRETLKRYWQTEIWNDAFDVLMNPTQHATQSEKVGRGMGGIKGLPASKLRSVRERMEQFLVENGEKKGLKQSLKKLEDKFASSSYYPTKKK